MKTALYALLLMVGCFVGIMNTCLMISTSMRDTMEEKLFYGTKNEGQGEDRSENDEGRSDTGKPEQ